MVLEREGGGLLLHSFPHLCLSNCSTHQPLNCQSEPKPFAPCWGLALVLS